MTLPIRRFAALAGLALGMAACRGSGSIDLPDLDEIGAHAALADERDETREPAAITAIALSADGRLLGYGNAVGAFQLFKVPRFEPLTGESRFPYFVTSPEIVAASWRADLFCYLTRAGSLQFPAAHPTGSGVSLGRISGGFIAPGGDVIAWSQRSRLLFQANVESPRDSFTGRAVPFAADIDVIAAAATQRELLVVTGRPGQPAAVEWFDRQGVEAGGSGPRRRRVELGVAASAIAVDETARRFVVAVDHGVELRSLDDGALVARIATTESVPHAVGDGRRFALVQGDSLAFLNLGSDGRAPTVSARCFVHKGGITAIALSADGRTLATGGALGDVRLFRIRPATHGVATP